MSYGGVNAKLCAFSGHENLLSHNEDEKDEI
jgi:hypothetical protein